MSIPTATTTDRDRRPIGFGIFLIVTGAVAWYAAMQLITERIALLLNPDYVLNCDVNPLVSCGTVMTSPEASLFGFPNPLLGVAGLVAPIAVGVALLAGARFARWFWAVFLGGVTLAWVFVMWLFGEAVYDIGALCPYCMAVWAVTVPIFWYVTLRNLDRGAPSAGRRQWAGVLMRNHSIALTVWFLVLIALIAQRFWSYWSTLL